jgi:hypothetical protein
LLLPAGDLRKGELKRRGIVMRVLIAEKDVAQSRSSIALLCQNIFTSLFTFAVYLPFRYFVKSFLGKTEEL